MSHAPQSRSRLTFAALTACLLLGVTELLSYAVGRFLGPALDIDIRRTPAIFAEQTVGVSTLLDEPNTLIQLDSLLGWRYRPLYREGPHALNGAGMRGTREYPVAPMPTRRRVAAFGDSFVYGNEVGNEEHWSYFMESADSTLEVLNFGVGGYGTDQAFLRYLREGVAYAPQTVLIGFAPVNLRRAENVYRRFISTTEPPIVKPRFKLDTAGGLVLVPNPLARRADWEALRREPSRALQLGEHDAWYDAVRYENPLYDWSATVRLGTGAFLRVWRKYGWSGRLLEGDEFREISPGFALQRTLLNTFADSVTQRGSRAAFLLLPDRESVLGLRDNGPIVYAPMRRALEADGRAVVLDAIEAFRGADPTEDPLTWFAPGGHYSPRGNALVAQWLAGRLRTL